MTLCYSCDVLPRGQSAVIPIDKDILVIQAAALDCSASLTDRLFQNPASIAYNSAGSVVPVVPNGYSDIFNHNQQTDCVIQKCLLKVAGCGSSLPVSTDV